MSEYRAIFESRGHLYNRATARCPGARATERRLLLDLLGLEGRGVARVLDAPAGGGYVAEGIRARLPGAEVVCLEASRAFAAGVDPALPRVIGEVERMPLASGSINAIASLAGLHHVSDKDAFFAEARRVLRPGGRVAVADVLLGSPPARFLDDVVDRLSSTGHRASFFAPGELTGRLSRAGFLEAQERVHRYSWDFPDDETLRLFCRDLFGLVRAEAEEVGREVARHLAIEAGPGGGRRLAWTLVYASGRRP